MRDPSGLSYDITRNFWVTDHGKVVSIKCHNEPTFSAIVYFI